MAIVLNGTTGITAPDIDVTAQSTDIVTTGDVSAVDGTFSGGVYLGGTGAANYLDDYEEGTWTPVLYDAASGGNSNNSSSYDEGHYTKIGNVVIARLWFINIELTGMTTGNIAYLGGLPFSAANKIGGFQGIIRIDRVTASGPTGFNLDANATRAVLTEQPLAGGSGTNLLISDLDNSSDIRATVIYQTDA